MIYIDKIDDAMSPFKTSFDANDNTWGILEEDRCMPKGRIFSNLSFKFFNPNEIFKFSFENFKHPFGDSNILCICADHRLYYRPWSVFDISLKSKTEDEPLEIRVKSGFFFKSQNVNEQLFVDFLNFAIHFDNASDIKILMEVQTVDSYESSDTLKDVLFDVVNVFARNLNNQSEYLTSIETWLEQAFLRFSLKLDKISSLDKAISLMNSVGYKVRKI